MNYLAGIDIGNANTEIAIIKDGVIAYTRQDSVISYLPSTPTGTDENVDYIIENIFDNLTVNFFSSKVKQNGVYYVGKKALTSNKQVRNMTISSGNKSDNDIPLITSLSMVAAMALKEYYETEKELPSELSVDLKMATAIPSSEYTLDKAKYLEKRFLEGQHIVTLFIADKTVAVTVDVTACKVTEEGKTAMLAFLNSDNDILENYNKTYKKKAVVTDFDESSALHNDIGDGTSEFVGTEGTNPYSSAGVRIGVGHATQEAIELYRSALGGNVGELKRQQFMDLLKRNNDKAQIAREKLETALVGQSSLIFDEISNAFIQLTNSNADYFFVHGGGSIVFNEYLYDTLVEYAKTVHGEVVWIPEKYATHMNSTGTLYLAKALFE